MTFVKGKSGNPNGRPDGAKGKKTLAMEERRAIFDAEMSKMFLDKIKKARPEYLLDQFIGKPAETVRHEGLEFLFEDKKKEDEETAKLV